MIHWIINGMIFCGAALMVRNIYGFIQFARFVSMQKSWKGNNLLLNIPIILLTLFLIGYLVVGIFGHPDVIVAGILFGGSIFVLIMYKLLASITQQILESEHMEAELLAREESNRIKSNFLASVSHEMRTPLNVILGMDNMALKNNSLPAEIRAQLEKISLSAKYLLGLINNILDINRIETGVIGIRNEQFHLKEIIDQVNAIAGTLCEEKGLDYKVTLPETVDGCYVGDALQIKKVLLRLLENAVKYTQAPGFVHFAVRFNPESETKHILIFSVSDSGIGMDEEFLPKLFDPFSQKDSSSKNLFGGSGLSLAASKNITELMGGDITVSSRKGAGSEFTVTIPLQYIGEDKPLREPVEETVTLKGCRVLIVDDLPANAEIVADLLDLEGVETEQVENGLLALEKLQETDAGYFQAVLMDLRMPIMDGLEAARRIRASEREDMKTIPIIALTANAFESDVQASLDAGMNAHLSKPVDADVLYNTLSLFIQKNTKQESAGCDD